MNAKDYIDYFNEMGQSGLNFFNTNQASPKYLILTSQHISDLLQGMRLMSIRVKANPDREKIYFMGVEILESQTLLEGFYLENPLK